MIDLRDSNYLILLQFLGYVSIMFLKKILSIFAVVCFLPLIGVTVNTNHYKNSFASIQEIKIIIENDFYERIN